MTQRTRRTRLTWAVIGLAGLACTALPANAGSPGGASPAVESRLALADEIWSSAKGGDETVLLKLLDEHRFEGIVMDPGVRSSLEMFRVNHDKREAARAEQIEKAGKELDDHLAAYDAEHGAVSLSKALTNAVELQLLIHDNPKFFADARVNRLLKEADKVAKESERQGEWMVASELFYRLDTIYDPAGTYKQDVDRLTTRLAMIRMYAPERLWELRNDRRLAEGLDALPPYNPYGDDFHTKLQGVNSTMIRTAIQRAAQQHVGRESRDNPNGTTMNTLLLGGVDAVRTMATTTDLSHTFPGLGSDAKRNEFVKRLDARADEIRGWTREASAYDLRRVVDGVLSDAQDTVGVMPEAVLHEFGNGAMGELDTYSAIIWPDELARFRRSTEGEFTGVGIQIQLDELQNITVVTPLEGTPAQRAGVRAGDVIKKIDGISAVGLGLDQAVEVITGPANTQVSLTVERTGEDDQVQELTFNLARQRIDLPSVKGWSKTGPGDQDWNWFIDPEDGIGYIRLTGFTDDSAADFDRAVLAMRQQGMTGMILDLRYNPGGLLDQAVEIASRFIPDGMVVKTVDAMGIPQEQQNARHVPSQLNLSQMPVVILVNEGSASASEIVSGSVQAAAHQGKTKALIVGQRSFGKGSVQNVYLLPGGASAMKLTTHYYRVDSPRMIHKLPGATQWGVDPDLEVDMLPSQQTDALLLRRDADVLPLDENGQILSNAKRPDPNTLLTDGIDLQVETALVLLQTQGVGQGETSMKD